MSTSAVIPIYNGAKYIATCISSILNQTKSFNEIIIVDDGSTDNSVKIVNELKNIHDAHATKIILISIPNSGVANARDVGIKACKNDLISLLDVDDFWHKNKNEIISNIFENYNIDLICTNIRTNNKNTGIDIKIIKFLANCYFVNKYLFLFKNNITTSSVTFKKVCYSAVNGFDKNLRYAEDQRLWMDFLFNKFKLLKINLSLTYYRTNNENSLSKNLQAMHKAEQSNFIYCRQKYKIPLLIYWAAKIFATLKYYRRILKLKLSIN